MLEIAVGDRNLLFGKITVFEHGPMPFFSCLAPRLTPDNPWAVIVRHARAIFEKVPTQGRSQSTGGRVRQPVYGTRVCWEIFSFSRG